MQCKCFALVSVLWVNAWTNLQISYFCPLAFEWQQAEPFLLPIRPWWHTSMQDCAALEKLAKDADGQALKRTSRVCMHTHPLRWAAANWTTKENRKAIDMFCIFPVHGHFWTEIAPNEQNIFWCWKIMWVCVCVCVFSRVLRFWIPKSGKPGWAWAGLGPIQSQVFFWH